MSDSQKLTSLHSTVAETSARLIDAFAEEQRTNLLCANNPADPASLELWRAARREVERIAEHYAIALEHYREAVLRALPRR